MGFLSFLTQGEKNPDVQTTSSTSYKLPSWASDYYQTVASTAKQVASQPYQQYTGQRVADLTANQNSAIDSANQNSFGYQPTLNAATNSASQGAQPFSEEGLNKFMNPYTNDVVNRISQLGWQDFDRNVAPRVQDEFVGSGGFGGKRNLDIFSQQQDNTQRNILGQQAGALQTGYQNAMQDYGNWQDRALNAANVQGGLAQEQSNLQGQGEQQLLATGALQQAQNQANLEVPYQYYQEQRDWPLRGLSALESGTQSVSAMPVDSTTVGTQPGGYKPSPLATGLGIGTALSGAGANNSWSVGLGALGMLGMISDRRLKRNIVKIGEHPELGIGIYEYDIGDEHRVGVMADELYEVMPDAVHVMPGGFLGVDYEKVAHA